MASTGGFDFSHLSLDQKIALIAQLWDDVAHQAAQQPLTKAQAEELDRRLAIHEAGAMKSYSWEEIKTSLLSAAP